MSESVKSLDPTAAATAEPAIRVHIVPVRVLLTVWALLTLLTAATVGATYISLGDVPALALWIAMGLATVKATLVVLYFMHLRYDKPFYGVILVTALIFVMLLVGLALTDSLAYQPDLRRFQERPQP